MASTHGFLGTNLLRDALSGVHSIGTLPSSNLNNTYVLTVASDGTVTAVPLEELMSLSSFGRLSTASPTTLFESTHVYELNTRKMETLVTGSATITHDLVNSCAVLTASTPDRAVIQSRRYVQYQPGKLLEWFFTGVLATVGTGSGYIRYGVFDDRSDKAVTASSFDDVGNGHFFEVTNAGLGVVERRMSGGSQTDTRVEQADFNLDPLDGTGSSGYNVDVTKSQIYFITKEWLGVGSVTLGVSANNKLYPCHKFSHENTFTDVYNTSGALPVRMEIQANGPGPALVAKQICTQCDSLGGFESNAVARRLISSGFNPTGTATIYYSMRLAEGYNRGLLFPRGASFIAGGFGSNEIVRMEVYAGGTPAVAPVWSTSSASPAIEISQTSSVLTGGTKLFEAYFTGTINALDFETTIQTTPLSSLIDGTSQIWHFVFTEVVGATGTGYLQLRFNEVR